MTTFDYTPPFEYTNGWRDIANSVSEDVNELIPDPSRSVVWRTENTFDIAGGATTTVVVSLNDPAVDAIAPEAGTDFSFTGIGTVTTALNRDSGQTISILLTAVGGAVTVTSLQLRARLLRIARTVNVSLSDPFSIGQFGLKSFQGSIPLATINDVLAVEETILNQYSQRTPIVKLHVQVKDTAHLTEILTRTISDRITIINGELALSGDFFVENVAHTIYRNDPDKLPVHEVVFGCDQVMGSPIANPFTFDVVGAGFDQGMFASLVADDPNKIFIFNDAMQGRFDFGVFAT